MCGIAGIINLFGDPVSPILLKKMTDAIAYRGPDSEGHWIEGCVGLGHRRLAIIDLTPAASQPIISADHRFVLVYNGEIYNYREIRVELESAGYWFRSKSDTEVVLYALAYWGTDALLKFNGMFALAIWDRRENTLLLARDRYGIKPLYYTFSGNTFLFGSEQKAILSNPTVKRELDLEALLEYFTFQNIFTDKTLFKDIHLLPAGCYATLSTTAEDRELKIERYWDFDFHEPDTICSENEYAEELDFLLRQAVRRQLISDVELGTYLSGGMDSGSITAIAAHDLPYIKTFTCGFDLHSASGLELGFDERQKAEHMSYLFKTEHYEMVLKAGDMERIMPRLIYHLEEPRVGQSYPNFYAAQLASKFVKVVLSGAGGDELFGGYPWRYYRAAICTSFDDYIDKYYHYWQRLVPNSTLQALFKPVWEQVKHVQTRDIFKSVFARRSQVPCTPEEYINHSLYFEAKTFLHGLLVVEDKLSSAHALETRVPFLDNDLVDFAMRLPVRMKLRNLDEIIRIDENEPGNKINKYFQKTNDGKILLRRVMQPYIPEQITNADKQGFSAPDASWFKGESIDYVCRTLFSEKTLLYEYMDKSVIRSLVEEHIRGERNRRLLVWSFLNVENWLRIFLYGER